MEFLKKLFPTTAAAGLCFLSCLTSRPIKLDRFTDPCSQGSFSRESSGHDKPSLLWKMNLRNSAEYSPAIALGALLIPLADNKLSIVSTNIPLRFAEIRFREPIVNSIAVSDSLVVLNTGGRRLLVVNWIKRQPLWQTDLEGCFGKPIVFDNRVIWFDGLGFIRCFDIHEGKRLWDLRIENAEFGMAEACPAGVVVFDDDGLIECLDPQTGRRIWSFHAGMRIRSQPVIFDDQLLFATTDGTVTRLDMSDGHAVWMRQLWSPVFGGLSCDSTGVYLGTNNRLLIKLGFADGRVFWKQEIAGPIKTGPELLGRFVVFAGLDHRVYFLNRMSGEIEYAHETEGMISARPVSCGERVFVAGEDGFLYCYQAGEDRK